ncbi:hypothetical protein GQ600_24634 [Phytophthora cactorum]|nr:hypothetical protein GQ600_24634 [Phytophthora cactorum]
MADEFVAGLEVLDLLRPGRSVNFGKNKEATLAYTSYLQIVEEEGHRQLLLNHAAMLLIDFWDARLSMAATSSNNGQQGSHYSSKVCLLSGRILHCSEAERSVD